MKKTYEFENLGCAHCAGKMEEKIGKLPDVESVNLSFPMKKMYVETSREDLLPEIQKICTDIEPDVIVAEVTKKSSKRRKHVEEDSHESHDVITTIMNMSTSNIITIMMTTATAGVNTIMKNMNTTNIITIMMTTAIVAAVMMTMTMMNQLQLLQIVKEMVRQPYLLSRN